MLPVAPAANGTLTVGRVATVGVAPTACEMDVANPPNDPTIDDNADPPLLDGDDAKMLTGLFGVRYPLLSTE